jgi:DNA polymerase IV (DinB-like DNA polymerase)
VITEIREDGKSSSSRIVSHIDFDYFYAQCEEIRRPEIKYSPVIICVYSGRTSDSGIVSTSNYVARKYGIKSGIPIKIAKSKLVNVLEGSVFLPADMRYYSQKSNIAMAVIKQFADKFEHIGVDECFIEITEVTGSDFGEAKELARELKNSIKKETGLTCSIGIASNKLLAKIASNFQKPDGLTVILPEQVTDFISKCDLNKIPGIGNKTRKRLSEMGIRTISELSGLDSFKLSDVFGKKTAIYLHDAARGIDNERVKSHDSTKQIGRIITLKSDATRSSEMYDLLQDICRSVHKMIIDRNVAFKNITILLILDTLANMTRSKSLKVYSTDLNELYLTAKLILNETMDNNDREIKVRRLGVKVSDLKDNLGQNTMSDFIR